jgi:hypothetical protein
MTRLLIFLLLATTVAAALPADFAAACANFHTENPKGWSFTQTTVAEGRSLTERCEAGRPEFSRWTLLAMDGHPPTAEETENYNEKRSRRSRSGTAPHIASQLDLASAELVRESPNEAVYRFRVKRETRSDKTAEFLRATLTFHRPSATITVFELSNVEPFSPVWGVRVTELRTTIHYSLPTADRPTLLDKITTRTKGRAYFKSLDADMLVTFTDYVFAGRQPVTSAPTVTDAGKAH